MFLPSTISMHNMGNGYVGNGVAKCVGNGVAKCEGEFHMLLENDHLGLNAASDGHFVFATN